MKKSGRIISAAMAAVVAASALASAASAEGTENGSFEWLLEEYEGVVDYSEMKDAFHYKTDDGTEYAGLAAISPRGDGVHNGDRLWASAYTDSKAAAEGWKLGFTAVDGSGRASELAVSEESVFTEQDGGYSATVSVLTTEICGNINSVNCILLTVAGKDIDNTNIRLSLGVYHNDDAEEEGDYRFEWLAEEKTGVIDYSAMEEPYRSKLEDGSEFCAIAYFNMAEGDAEVHGGDRIWGSVYTDNEAAKDWELVVVAYDASGNASDIVTAEDSVFKLSNDVYAASIDVPISELAPDVNDVSCIFFAIKGSNIDKSNITYGIGVFHKDKAVPELKAVKVTSSYVSLEWPEKDDADGYYVEKLGENGKWERIAVTEGADKTAYNVKDLSPATVYTLRVRAYTIQDKKRAAEEYTNAINVLTRPEQLTRFKAVTTGKTSIKLRWKRDDTADGYQFQIYLNDKWKILNPTFKENATTVSKNVYGLKSGMEYQFRVRSFIYDENGDEVYSRYVYLNAMTN